MNLLERLFEAQLSIGSQQILWREVVGNAFGFAIAPAGNWITTLLSAAGLPPAGSAFLMTKSTSSRRPTFFVFVESL